MVFPIFARLLTMQIAAPLQKLITEQLLRSPTFHRFVHYSENQVARAADEAAKRAREVANRKLEQLQREFRR
ncbi:hypothetical protein H9P43_008327 [Blastocladiella emersonii ATCC 22665]|nr:hypothetical protein H9P43_008327 [Blastocladiella emersonii ATCC 22665]